MIDKTFLKEKIESYFPDLSNTKFKFNNSRTESFIEQALIPFLIYQNTIDENHRLIALYLPEGYGIINLVPFYVMVGQYRKALNKVMQAENFVNKSFQPNQKQLILNGEICNVISVDFINRQVVFNSGRGHLHNIAFEESFKVTWTKNSEDILQQIESLDKIDKASQRNIFTFPLPPQTHQYEGVIIFTNTNKFDSLLRNITVSGTDLREYLHIQKVIFPSNDENIKFHRLSRKQTENKPVSLLIARQDAFRAYHSILEAGGGLLNHIKTIIIDDFDTLVDRWEKSDNFKEEVNWLNENYFKKVADKQIKDLYLISRNSSLKTHEIFQDLNIIYNPWLIKPLEEVFLNDQIKPSSYPKLTVTCIKDDLFESLNDKLNSLIDKWKILAQTDFCNGEILSPINCLYELRTKLNSFFDPDRLDYFTEDFKSNLHHLKQKWFAGRQDYNTIEQTEEFIFENLGANLKFLNFKLPSVMEALKNKDIKGPLIIVSDNSNTNDSSWLLTFLQTALPTIHATHYHKKDFYSISKDSQFDPEMICYLTSDKKLNGAAAGNVLAIEQIFLLGRRGYSFTVSYLKRFQHLQTIVGSIAMKYRLLNLNPPANDANPQITGLIPIHLEPCKVEQASKENELPPQDSDLQELVEEIIHKQHPNYLKEQSDQYLLFFDDGTLMQVPASKHFFIYEDDKETDDFEKSLRAITQLEVGDQIIVTKRSHSVKDLLLESLKKKPDFSHAISVDEKWRLLIKNHIRRTGMDLQYFSKKLLDNGFKIGPATIRNWIDGETQRPDNFRQLLLALSRLDIISEKEILSFDKCNAHIKSVQGVFVRTAVTRLIAKLNGIHVEEDEVFTDDLLSDFINHIDIKRIIRTHKI